jgi:hypothetical protein
MATRAAPAARLSHLSWPAPAAARSAQRLCWTRATAATPPPSRPTAPAAGCSCRGAHAQPLLYAACLPGLRWGFLDTEFSQAKPVALPKHEHAKASMQKCACKVLMIVVMDAEPSA